MKEHTRNLNIYTIRNLNLTNMQKHKNCSRVCVCVYHCAQLLYTTQHRAVLIIFPLILRSSTRAQMLSTGGGGGEKQQEHAERETYRCTESKNNPLRQTQTDTQRHADTATRTCCIQA